jgi:MFS family permease
LQAVILALMPLAPRLGFSPLGFLFGATSLYWIACSIAVPAWQSWMGELVPTSDRGRFFAERNRISQLLMFAALLGGGFILQALPNAQGFAVVLGLGVVGRLLALSFFRLHRDIPLPPPEDASATLGRFLRGINRTKFGRYVLFASFFAFAVNLSASYFTPYLLTELKFSYLEFVALLAVMIGARFLTAPAWGRLIDRHGSRKPLAVACLLFCLAPLLWTLSQNLPYLIFLNVVSGIAAGGFELCSFNFMLENTAPEERTRFAAYHELFTGLGIVSGAVAGGLLIRYAPSGFSPYFMAFLASGALRAFLAAVFLPRLR